MRPLPIAALAFVLALGNTGHTAAQSNPPDLMKLNEQASDPERAKETLPNLRSILATAADSSYAGIMRQMILRALVTSKAPVQEIVAAADSAVPYLGPQARVRVPFFASVGGVVAQRGGPAELSLAYARRAVAELPDGEEGERMRPFALQILGYVHLEAGNGDSAITHLTAALPASSDSQSVLLNLGEAYTATGKLDAAVDAYVRSLAIFPGTDTTGLAALKAVHAKNRGTPKELDTRLTTARRASRERIALEPHRHQRAAPEWMLNDVNGKPFPSSSLKGKVAIVDFWGSWCGPCRYELPLIEAFYQRYKKNPRVRFLGVNWERDKNQHAKLAREFMTKNNITFPTVIDPDQIVVTGFGITGFPTVFVVDAKGQIRYRNIGAAQNIEEILEAQVQSLLE